ncbi:MAG: glycerate kinase [Proteobacteria bacterium]|nr:glycerate kinase [Pseudomonadota bacterium]
MRTLVAPCGFKESLTADQAADAMARGVYSAVPTARVLKAPMVDGGEGFTNAIVRAAGGALLYRMVKGPVGKTVCAHFGLIDTSEGRTGVIEMAAAAGLRLVPRSARDPRQTTSYGVGELMGAALDAGAQRLLIGCGDSGICDGGAGMAQALGIGLLDGDGNPIGLGGSELLRLRQIDLSTSRIPRESVHIDVAVNWHNELLGPRGVARVFGPQKGAGPEAIRELEAGLENLTTLIWRSVRVDVGSMAGAGASGGLGAGLAGLLGARLHPRYDIVMQYLELDELLKRCDVVLTAEGQLDEQTPRGKVPAEIGRRAKLLGLPVIALAGRLGRKAELNLKHGIDAYFSIVDGPRQLDTCLQDAQELLQHATEHALRTVQIGRLLQARNTLRRTERRTPTSRPPGETPATTRVHDPNDS